MVNRYDQPAQARFINTYVPIPFQELMMAGQQRQKVLDENLARLDAFQSNVDNLKAIPNSKDYAKLEKLRTASQDLSNRYLDKDLSDPDIYHSLNREARQLFNANEIGRITESRAGYDTYMKQLAELTARGEAPPSELLFNFNNYDSGATGVFSQLPRAGVDVKKATAEFFNQMDSQYLGPVEIDDNGTMALMHGVTIGRLNEHANLNAREFADSPAGRQIVDVAKANGDSRSKEQIALEYLLNEAPEYVKSNVGGIFNRQTGNGNNDKSSKYPSTSNGPEISVEGYGDYGRFHSYTDINQKMLCGNMLLIL